LSEQTSLQPVTRAVDVPAPITVSGYAVGGGESAESLLEYWQIIVRRRWTIIGIALLVIVTIMIGVMKQRKMYRATAVLQVDRENTSVTLSDVIDPYGTDELYLETIYKNLQSRTLARRVITRLQLDKHPDFTRESEQPKQAAAGPSDGEDSRVVDNFLEALTVSPIQRSRLVEIQYASYEADLAARIANTLANSYIEYNLEVKWEDTQKASEKIAEQLVGLKAKLEKSEEELQSYAQRNSILLIDERQSMTSERLKQLQEEYTRAEADRIQKEAIYSQFRSGDTQTLPAQLENQTYQQLKMRLADLRREYSELTATFTAEYPKVKRVRNQIDETEAALESERRVLLRRINDEYRSAVSRSRLLGQAVGQQTNVFNDVAEKSIQYNILKREVDTNRQLYDGLLQRLKEASVSAGLKASNIRVVDAAETPTRPFKPRIVFGLAIAVVLGTGLGLGAAFLQHYLDNTLKTPDDVQRYLHLPALGVIPANLPGRGKLGYGYKYGYGYGYGSRRKLLKSGEQPAAGEDKLPTELIGTQSNNALSEAYRSLRTSVLLSTPGQPPRIILVTSAHPGEGKTTTAMNLGITLAQLGGRVLIIDSDMRKPRVGYFLGIKNAPTGLSTYLVGQSSLEQSVRPTAVPNLFAMPCGPIPPNPAELMSSDMMRQLLEEAREKFEYLVLDSPPVLHVSDARIIAAQVGVVILVAHGGSTPRETVNHAKEYLLQVNANVIGVVLNNVDFSQVGYDYYYRYYRSSKYGYGYGYGYGTYGQSEEEKEESKPVSAT